MDEKQADQKVEELAESGAKEKVAALDEAIAELEQAVEQMSSKGDHPDD